MRRILNKKLLLIFPLLIFIVAVCAAVYFYQKYQAIRKNPQIVSQEQVKTITEAISQYLNLPSDEQPTLATVTDISKLKGQDFFKNAKNGDDVLIYTKAQKAILYRPSTNKVIEFAPLSIGAQNQNATQPITVAIYNGTQVSGLTGEYETKLSQVNGLSVTVKANAAKNDYTKTLVIDISGKNTSTATQIAQLLGGTVVSQVPVGETTPQTDILVIAGQ